MSEYRDSIIRVCQLEEENGIFEDQIDNIPIWTCVFRKYRDRFIEKKSGVPPMISHTEVKIKKILSTSFKSGLQLLKLLSSKNKIDNVIYGFPRLEQIDGVYVDKFCDGLISEGLLSGSFLYLERGRSYIHLYPRKISNVTWTEFIDLIAYALSLIGMPITYLKNYKTFHSLFEKASNIVELSNSDKRYIIRKVSTEINKKNIYLQIFRKHKVQRIFAPVLHNIPSLIGVAKSLDIPCFELQHGITEGPTPLYSGKYLPDFSPTAFLAFGKTSMTALFNVPIEKMYNIGFAYKKMLLEIAPFSESNHFLFISDPEITQEIIDVACMLKRENPECIFSIRFHPMEKPLEKQINQLQDSGIIIADRKENSTLTVLRYEGVIGEKSTVLYEALNMKRKTAKIHFHKLNKEMDEDTERSRGFFILNNLKDFQIFKGSKLQKKDIPEFYSDFSVEEFNKIMNFKHFS